MVIVSISTEYSRGLCTGATRSFVLSTIFKVSSMFSLDFSEHVVIYQLNLICHAAKLMIWPEAVNHRA